MRSTTTRVAEAIDPGQISLQIIRRRIVGKLPPSSFVIVVKKVREKLENTAI